MKLIFLRRLILGVFVLFSPTWVCAAPGPSYAAIVDAGSSGSRIYLYKIEIKGAKTRVEDLWSAEPKDVPGLSDFKDRAGEVYAAGIVPLLAPLQTALRNKGLKESDISLDVLATGGLRLLDADQSEAILKGVRTGLTTTKFKLGRVEILPPELEGVLAWADLNALLDRFTSGKETLGVVEIGGASSQIAYELRGQTEVAAKTWLIQGHPYRIFSRSFLGLGQNAARKSMVHSVGGGIEGNPCYPHGVIVADKKIGVDGLTGAFDFSRCRNLYQEVIRLNPDLDSAILRGADHQAFVGIGQGNPIGPIQGSIRLWKLKGSNPYDSLNVIETSCRSSWPNFRDQFGGDLVNQNQCANSVFIETLLYDSAGFGLGSHQLKHLASVGGRVPSWTRGLVLLQGRETH